LGVSPDVVRSAIVLAPNERFIAAAAETASSTRPFTPPSDIAGLMHLAMTGLTSHNVPHVRALAPQVDELHIARWLQPFGYDIGYRSGASIVRMLAFLHSQSRVDWTLEAWGAGHHLHIEFPPSYVLAGSATATLRSGDGERRWRFPDNGYQAQWRELLDVANGKCAPRVTPDELLADLAYAIGLAEGAADQTAGVA
jgi:hypothetical protein